MLHGKGEFIERYSLPTSPLLRFDRALPRDEKFPELLARLELACRQQGDRVERRHGTIEVYPGNAPKMPLQKE